ncbi:MDR family MFS transporter [Kibdelosporangium lantanae]
MATITPLDPALRRLARILSLGSIATLLDTTMVNIALEHLRVEFGVSVATVQWVSTAYLLALTAVLPVAGWAVERVGSRRLWLASLAAFTAGSVLCALSWSAPTMIVFRVVQGLSGGMLLPLVRIVLIERAGRAQLGRLTGTVVLSTQLAPVFGPVLGGLVVQTLGWRAAFLINVPVGAAAFVLSWRAVGEHTEPRRSPLDVRGVVLLTLGLTALVYGLSAYGTTGTAPVVPIVVGAVSLLGYLGHARLGGRPVIIDLRLFADRNFAACAALVFVFGGAVFGALFLLPLLVQQTRGADVLTAGLLLAPQGLGAMAGTRLVGRWLDRTGATRTPVLVGLALTALGTLGPALSPTGLPTWLLVVGLVVRGAGLSFSLVPTMTATYATLPPDTVASATVASRMLQQIGGSLATAGLAVVLARGIAAHPDHPADAFATAFWITLATTLLAAVAALALPAGRRARWAGRPAPATAGTVAEWAWTTRSTWTSAARRAR